MAWYLAPALEQLRRDIKERWPNRDYSTDGALGDASHSARPSDHNPDYSAGGIVRAIDVDDDGWPAIEVQDYILARCKSGAERRLNYLIHNRRIYSASRGFAGVAYTGVNAHESHIHFSLRHDSSNASTASWLPSFAVPEDDLMSDAQYNALNAKIDRINAVLSTAFGVGPGQKTPGGTQAATLGSIHSSFNADRADAAANRAGFAAMGADMAKFDEALAAVDLNVDQLRETVVAALSGAPDGATVEEMADAVVLQMGSRLAS